MKLPKLVNSFEEYNQNLELLKSKMISTAFGYSLGAGSWWGRNWLNIFFFILLGGAGLACYSFDLSMASRVFFFLFGLHTLQLIVRFVKKVVEWIKQQI